MNSKKPYLLRAYYDWIRDNQLTPYILVNAKYPNVEVPTQYVRDGKIVLDISAVACRGLDISAKGIQFSARFSGQLMQIILPLESILAIYAKENSEGTTFQPETAAPAAAPVEIEKNVSKPFLSVVRNDDN
ncbi:MAG TPA: ClpXP protease specificity-enhancing factor [Legionellales bacterium]|nr:ClpXP protease specificity-enhancing factor [Legionellales bacterium]